MLFNKNIEENKSCNEIKKMITVEFKEKITSRIKIVRWVVDFKRIDNKPRYKSLQHVLKVNEKRTCFQKFAKFLNIWQRFLNI